MNDLQRAMPGDEIVLSAGTTYVGPFTLPAPQGSSGWVIIRSSGTADPSFPHAGVRVEKGHEALLAQVVAPNNSPAFVTETGADHYWLIGLEITGQAGATSFDSLVPLGDESSESNAATNIVLDRVYVHGSSSMSIKHGVFLNGGNLAVINSRIGDVHTIDPPTCPNAPDSQGIVSINGSGPYKIDNNYISASTEGVMFGGDNFQPTPTFDMMPHDIVISRNHIYKPITTAWRTTYLAKSGFELKVAYRAAIEYNLVENAWDNCPGENAATWFRVTVRNQDSNAPFDTIAHVMVRSNEFVNSPEGVLILGGDDANPSDRMNCVAFENNLFDRIPGDFAGDYTHDGGIGRMFTVVSGGFSTYPGGIQNLTIEHNTINSTAGPALLASYGGSGRTDLNTGFVFRNNLSVSVGGLLGDGVGEGDSALNTFFDSATDFARNDLVSSISSKYAGHCSADTGAYNYCFFSSDASAVGFSDYPNDDLQLSSTSPDHLQCTHQFSNPPTPHDLGVQDWSSTTGIGAAAASRDVQPDYPPGCTDCSGDCVDLNSDPFHCGSCTLSCPAGEACVSMQCVAGSCNGTLCGTVCVDTQTDPNNCGGCGVACGTNMICAAGTCACNSGLSECGGVCVDEQADPSNCGSCGHVCTQQQSCLNGACAGGTARLVGTDINADLRGDFLARGSSGDLALWKSDGTVEVYSTTMSTYYTDTANWNSGNRFFAMDFNGDGRTDLLARGTNGGWDVNLSNGTTIDLDHSFYTAHTDAAGWNDANRFLIADVDGDRRLDLLGRQSDGTFQVLKSDGETLSVSTTFGTSLSDANGFSSPNRFFAIDLNGDGKTDFMVREADGSWYTWMSNGATYVQTSGFSSNYSDANGYDGPNRFFVLDIDGDGKGDLLVRGSDGTFHVWKSNGLVPVYAQDFSTWLSDVAGFDSGNHFVVVDANGDGKTDMMVRYSDGGWDIFQSDGNILSLANSFSSNYTDADGWSTGLRFF